MKKILFWGILFIITVLYFFDFGFLKGEITEYSLLCNKENYIDYRCSEKWLPLNPTTYKPNANKQQVIYSILSVFETLDKCSVVNRKNWTCEYNDGSATFGFKNGQYWEFSTESITDELFEYRYVPKHIYKLEEMKWW